jgi:hypothetical protein
MELGEYYKQNQNRIALLNEGNWKVAIKKCKDHIRWKLKQKTLSGAHSASRLGADPIEHYLGIAYEKILLGEWEWKKEYTLVEQMIRIIDSYISAEVEKRKTKKEESLKVDYIDIENEFYDLVDPPDSLQEEAFYAEKLQKIENAIKGDSQLELFLDSVKEGMKRADIAELLDLRPRQLDKVRERLLRKVRTYQSSLQ